MIDTVKQGEKITAEGQNKIIDAVNELTIGNFNSSDGFNFGRQKSRDGFPCLFQCKVGRGFTMTSREDNSYSNNPTTTTWLFLGKDKTTLFANVGLQIQKDHFLVMSPTSAAKGDLQDSWFKRNGSSSYYDGWIDIQYSDGTPVWLMKGTVEKKDKHEKICDVVLIDSSSSQSQLKSDCLTLCEENDIIESPTSDYDVKPSNIICLAEYTIDGRMPGTSGSSPSDFHQQVQLHTGALPVGGGASLAYTADSALSSLGLSSIQERELSGQTYFQLFDFENSYMRTKPDKGKDNIVLARFDNGKSRIIYAELSAVVDEGGGGGSYSEVKVDEVSIDKEGSNDSLELRAFQTATATEFLAERLVTESDMDKEYLERASGENGNTLEYVQQGCFKSGSDSNITFTKQNGNVYINVYYT